MDVRVERLTLQFLAWVAERPRSYAECMDTWRTSCPRLSVWEDALSDGLIQIGHSRARSEANVILTPRGKGLMGAQASPSRDES